MPRTIGTKNKSAYRYQLTDKNITTYHITQKEIQDKYNLSRTAIYFLLHKPEKTINAHNIEVVKLDTPLPIYDRECFKTDDITIISLKKIKY
tara:strand:+ start:372 stop:647 length:276 start_codon:yes stop_codon:yes gene_type:complete